MRGGTYKFNNSIFLQNIHIGAASFTDYLLTFSVNPRDLFLISLCCHKRCNETSSYL